MIHFALVLAAVLFVVFVALVALGSIFRAFEESFWCGLAVLLGVGAVGFVACAVFILF